MAKLQTKYVEVKASSSYTLVSSDVSYSFIQSITDHVNLSATNVFLDPDTLNRYFRLETFSVSDIPVLTAEKNVGDVFGASDEVTNIDINKPALDSLSMGDVALVRLLIKRSFFDSFTLSEEANRLVGLGRLNSVSISESSLIDSVKSVVDSFSLNDRHVVSFETEYADNVSFSDLLQRTVSYVRSFEDTSFLGDSLVTASSKATEDTYQLTDNFDRTVSFVRDFSNAVSVSEFISQDVSKNVTDTFGISELFNRSLSYSRVFADTFVLDDFTDIGAITKDTLGNKANVISFNDTQTFSTSKAITDIPVVTDSPAVLTERPAADGLSVSDVFQKVTTYSRAFTDAYALTDVNTKTVTKPFSDSSTVTDSLDRTVEFERTFSDAINFASNSVMAFEKSLSDSASITESINVQVTSLASSVFNAGAFNSTPLNN